MEKASIDKVLANAEIEDHDQRIRLRFSEGYGNDFDITRLRYDKIIIMADADGQYAYFYIVTDLILPIHAGSDL